MTYGYIRVSTLEQTVENQRFEVLEFAKRKNLLPVRWVEETVSGTKQPESRKLGQLLAVAQPADVIICSELSRLGRSLFMIIRILNQLLEQKVELWTIKDNFHLMDDITSKVIAFAFGLSAEIERNLISQRTKEALARLKSQGVRLGRPPVLVRYKGEIEAQVGKVSLSALARRYHVSWQTMANFVHNTLDR